MRIAAIITAGLCAAALSACGDTLQVHPFPHSTLEGLIVAPYPVYWLGGSFEGMAISEAKRDPSGSYNVQYGNCLEGGQGVCVPPLRIVTSPDNSFLPGGAAPTRPTFIRGVGALLTQAGHTVVIPTAGVVVDIYAQNAKTARAAAQTMVPINAVGAPGAPLPARLPDTGFADTPLPSQTPSLRRALG